MQPKTAKLQVRHLHTFREVYNLGGYAAAAAESELSVPTIWQHIQALEKVYGVRLFEKKGRQVKATAAATHLYNSIHELLEGLESTYELIKSDTEPRQAIALVTGNRMLQEDLLQPLAKFQKQFSTKLVIRNGNNKRAEELLLANKADIAFTLEPGPNQRSPFIRYEPLYFVDFLAVSPKRHPFNKSKPQGLRQLVKYPLVVTEPGTHGRDALEQAMYRERLEANIVVETENSGFTIACVQAGMGLGILAGQPDGPLCQKLATHSLIKQLGRRQIVCMRRKGSRLDKTTRALIDEVMRFHEAAPC